MRAIKRIGSEGQRGRTGAPYAFDKREVFLGVLDSNFECQLTGLGVLSSSRKREYRRGRIEYSFGWPDLERTDTPPVEGLEPSDRHRAIVLDDINGDGNFRCCSRVFLVCLVANNGFVREGGKGRKRLKRSHL